MAQQAITHAELEADQARQEVTFVQALHALERRLDSQMHDLERRMHDLHRQMHALERRMYATAAIVGGLGVAIVGILIKV